MKNRIKAVVVLLVGVATMLGLALAGGSSASAATVGAQNFVVVSSNAAATTNPVLATGVIHARGTDTQRPNGSDVFRFRNGALLVTHHRVAGTDNLDRLTCLDRFTERGTYAIVAGSRDYRGARGVGAYNLTGLALYQKARSGRCLTNRTPDVFQLVIEARGGISLPLV